MTIKRLQSLGQIVSGSGPGKFAGCGGPLHFDGGTCHVCCNYAAMGGGHRNNPVLGVLGWSRFGAGERRQKPGSIASAERNSVSEADEAPNESK